MAKNKRKRMFVDIHVQGALLRQLIVHWIFASISIFAYLLVLQLFGGGLDKPFTAHLHAMWARYAPLFVALVVIFPVFAYDSLKLSNRFAGPMVSFRNALKTLARGEPVKPLSFRKGDFWRDLAVDFNRVADQIQADQCRDNPAAAEHADQLTGSTV